MNFAVAAVTSENANGQNSLEQIYTQADADVAYVQENNRFYRWFAASTTAPNGTTVVIPRFTPLATAGRWFVQGPPGPGQLPAGFANLLCNAGFAQIIAEFSGTLTGGTPTELFNFTEPAYTDVLWDATNALALVAVATSNPAIQARGNIPASNNIEACVIDTSGANLPAVVVRGWVLRNAVV